VTGAPDTTGAPGVGGPDAAATVAAVWRLEGARIVAGVARLVRDVGLAEELAQDAVLAALQEWPTGGVPANPAGWLALTARHRAIDRLRRNDRLQDKLHDLGRAGRAAPDDSDGPSAYDAVLDDVALGEDVKDDLLRLMFTACHPVLSRPLQVALTLKVLGGLSTAEIARGFLVPEATVAQRIVRAKRALAEAGVPFEIPPAPEQAQRLTAICDVLYLVYNEGYTATSGDRWTRPELCYEALRLGRVLAHWASGSAEIHGLAALMELQSSRLPARLGPDGEPVPLLEQNRGRWDRLLIRRGLTALLRARQAGAPGPYVLQAAIASCHAQARDAEDTDWERIAALYTQLNVVTPSPVVALNHAVAVAMAGRPAEALSLVDAIAGLDGYHPLHSVRADLLARLGRHGEARTELERAVQLTSNTRERDVLRVRAASLVLD
jgi:predicted RNA polymerase sigma factor